MFGLQSLRAVITRWFEVAIIRWRNHGADLYEIIPDPNGLRINKNKLFCVAMQWGEMQKMLLHQRDMYTYELVMIYLVDKSEKPVLIHELMPGYLQFCESANGHFPGFAEAIEKYTQLSMAKWETLGTAKMDLKPGEKVELPQEWLAMASKVTAKQ